MPFEPKGTEPLDAVINVRVTAAERERLRDDAGLAGLSVSDLVRRRCTGRTVTASVDLAVLRELRRLGGLLKHVHVMSDGAYSEETAAAMAALREYIERLSHDR